MPYIYPFSRPPTANSGHAMISARPSSWGSWLAFAQGRSPRGRMRFGGLIFSLIRLRSSTFIIIRIYASIQVANVYGIRRTTILTPENRKIGGATIAWATISASVHTESQYSRCGSHGGSQTRRHATRVPQTGVNHGQPRSLLTTASRRLAPGPGHY